MIITDGIILEPSVLSDRIRAESFFQGVASDVGFLAIPDILYEPLEENAPSTLMSVIDDWGRYRDIQLSWMEDLCDTHYPRWRETVEISSTSDIKESIDLTFLPEQILDSFDIFNEFKKVNSLASDILETSLYGTIPIFSLDRKFLHHLRKLEIPTLELLVECMPYFKELRSTKIKYVKKIKDASLSVYGRRIRFGHPILWLAELIGVVASLHYIIHSLHVANNEFMNELFKHGVTHFTIQVLVENGNPW